MSKIRHFKSLLDINKNEFLRIIDRASELKKEAINGVSNNSLANKTMAMIFKKNSTRTRVAFETAMTSMGGHAIFLPSDLTQISRGEELSDTAKVLSGMVDIIMIRTHDHDEVEELAKNSSVPVINGLTEKFHPCQLLADMQTYFEEKGPIEGKKVSEVLGIARGNTVRSRNVARDIFAALKNVVGGEIDEYTKLQAQAREQAINRMKDDAISLGADAVINVRITTSMIMQGCSEIMAYGTAVKL